MSEKTPTTTTRGGWTPTGTGATRRENVRAGPGTKAARTRNRLLEAARKVFGDHGYLDSTVELIVEEAGLSRGSFYTYFESRTDVFRQLAATIDERIDTDVVTVERTGDVIENLAASTRGYLAVVRENADLYRLAEQISVYDDDVRRARLRSRQHHVTRVAATIRRWQERGIADAAIDPDTTAGALVSMQSGFAQWVHVGGDDHDEDEVAATITDIWVRACGLRRDDG